MIGFVNSVGAGLPTLRTARCAGKSAKFVSARRTVVRAETKEPASKYEAKLEEDDASPAADFIDKMQNKFQEYTNQIQKIDVDDFSSSAKTGSKRLANNFIAGEWLQRGETYGVVQIVVALFILRPQGGLDGLVSLLFGPTLLLGGAFVCAKAMLDLGINQLSIWPKPVPEAELKTGGIYEYVRHPIYSGVLISSFGFAVATASPARVALTIALTYFFMKKVEVEEEFLTEAFGEDYEEYAEAVPYKIIPKVF